MFEAFIIAKGLYKAQRGRKPKLTDAQICSLYLASSLLAIPILKIVKALGLNVQSWHIFRRYRTKRIYRCLRSFLKELNIKTQGRQVIIVDGKLLPVARVSRALTQRIKRGFGGKSWGRRKRKLYSQHKQQQLLVDELVYGLLIMALVDGEGKVVDIWLKPASTNETRALKERLRFSNYLRAMVEGKELIGDKGYRGVKGLKIAESREEKRKRQVVEVFFAKLKFLELSGWRYKLTILTYLTALGVASFALL